MLSPWIEKIKYYEQLASRLEKPRLTIQLWISFCIKSYMTKQPPVFPTSPVNPKEKPIHPPIVFLSTALGLGSFSSSIKILYVSVEMLRLVCAAVGQAVSLFV